MAIDTHEGFKTLIEAGVPEPQAEAQVALFSQWAEQQLVTREYLDQRIGELESWMNGFESRMDEQKTELRQEIAGLRGEMKRQNVELRGEMKQQNADLREETRTESAKLRQEMAELEKRLTNRIVATAGMMTTVLGILIVVVRFIG